MGLPETLAGSGLVMKAYSGYMAGEEAAATGRYNEEVARRAAQAQSQRTEIQMQRHAEDAARKASELRALLSASGAVPSTDAALNIVREQARQSELEQRDIAYTGTVEEERLLEEGRMARRTGQRQRRASRIGVGTTLLTGFGEAFA